MISLINGLERKQKLAEFIGIMLGDGNLNRQSNCITIVGSLEDKHYFVTTVIPIIQSLFQVNPKLRRRNDTNAYYIDFNSRQVMDFLTAEIGLVRGNKVNASIPLYITSSPELIPCFLRGLFDTDGCIKFSKQKNSKNYYPRIQFCLRYAEFSKSLGPLMESIGFRFCYWKEIRLLGTLLYYQLSGLYNLEAWMSPVRPHNMVHMSKYLFWRRFGYCPPKSSLTSRCNALSLNIVD
jgi:hypothetical protein